MMSNSGQVEDTVVAVGVKLPSMKELALINDHDPLPSIPGSLALQEVIRRRHMHPQSTIDDELSVRLLPNLNETTGSRHYFVFTDPKSSYLATFSNLCDALDGIPDFERVKAQFVHDMEPLLKSFQNVLHDSGSVIDDEKWKALTGYLHQLRPQMSATLKNTIDAANKLSAQSSHGSSRRTSLADKSKSSTISPPTSPEPEEGIAVKKKVRVRNLAASRNRQVPSYMVTLKLKGRTEPSPPKVRKGKNNNPLRLICVFCGSKSSPEWRTGPPGMMKVKNPVSGVICEEFREEPRNLCNACGLFYRKVKVKFGGRDVNGFFQHWKDRYPLKVRPNKRQVPATLPEGF